MAILPDDNVPRILAVAATACLIACVAGCNSASVHDAGGTESPRPIPAARSTNLPVMEPFQVRERTQTSDKATSVRVSHGKESQTNRRFRNLPKQSQDVITDIQRDIGPVEWARTRIALADFDGAIASCNSALAANPNDAEAYELRAQARDQKQQRALAIADYSHAISLRPNDASLYEKRGQIRYELTDYVGTIEDDTKAILLDPKTASHYAGRADAEYMHGSDDDALRDYDIAITLDPQSDYRGARAEVRRHAGDYTGAIADASAAILSNPKGDYAYNVRGRAYLAEHEANRAADDLTTALQLNSDTPHVHANLGDAYYMLHEDDRAIAEYTTALQTESRNAVIHFNRGKLYYKQGRYAEAATDFDAAVSENPSDANVLAYRARANQAIGREDAAIADADRAEKLNPNDGGNLTFLAGELLGQNRAEEALGAADQAIKAAKWESNRTVAHLIRGVAKEQLGRWNAALGDLDFVISKIPTHAEAHLYRASAYLNLDQPARAIADAKAVLSASSSDARACVIRARANLELGDMEAMWADVDQAVVIDKTTTKDSNLRDKIIQQIVMWYPEHVMDRGEVRGWPVVIADLDKIIPTFAAKNISIDGLYIARATAKMKMNDPAGAIDDYTAAASADPANAGLLYSRGLAYERRGDFNHARVDLQRAVELKPMKAYHYVYGRCEAELGDWRAAASEFGRAAVADKFHDPYGAIYETVALLQSSSPQATKPLEDHLREWPDNWQKVIAGFLLGTVTEQKLLSEANQANSPDAVRGRDCEADFYIGLVHFARGDLTGARLWWEKAVATNETTFFEFAFATTDLRRMTSADPR